MDAPGEGGVDAVVAVAGEQAANAADAIADGGGGGCEVEHTEGGSAAGEAVGLRSDALVHEHGDAGEQTTVPREAGLEPVEEVEEDFGGVMDAGEEDVTPCGTEVGDALELVPELSSYDTGKNDHGNDVQCVGIGAVADEILVQQDGPRDGRQPEHQAEGTDVSKSEIYVGIHSEISIGPARTARVGSGRGLRAFLRNGKVTRSGG